MQIKFVSSSGSYFTIFKLFFSFVREFLKINKRGMVLRRNGGGGLEFSQEL